MLTQFPCYQFVLSLFTCLIVFFGISSQSSGQEPEWIEEEDYLYRAYFDFSAYAGGQREIGQGLLFVPLAQDEERLFFADLRGNIFDDSSAEGNFGLAYRQMIDDQWIAGAYIFYDVRRSRFDNTFQQGSFGFDLLSIEWDFRFNGYVPTLKKKPVNSLSTSYLSGSNIVVQGGEERAYWGTDFEVGRLITTFQEWDVDAELRGYVGGYYFDNSAAGFKQMTGPRARIEFRMFDLPILGNGSRVVLGGQYQYDDVRGSQGTGMLTLRVPLPGNGDSKRLSRFQRRMVAPIVRDIDIVLNQARGPIEQAKLQSTGQVLKDITIIDANTVDAESVFNSAGADSVVLFDGSAGTINTNTGFVFNNGQLALAGGKSVNVVGCSTGSVASFNYGSQPTVNGTVNTIDVFTMADNSSIVGMNITGGQNGIYGNGISGFTIACNTISGAFEDGTHLDGNINGDIIDNTFRTNGIITDNDGLEVENFVGGNITGNTSELNPYGFYVSGVVSGGTIANNTANNNLYAGFYFEGDVTGGDISNNHSRENGIDGFVFEGDIIDGTISNNTASFNGFNGFAFVGFISGGAITHNMANQNIEDGFYFDTGMTDGDFSYNSATQNGDDGFDLFDISGGTISYNTASKNTENGIKIEGEISGGSIMYNSATENTTNGFEFFLVTGGTISNNTATGNKENGIKFAAPVVDGTISNNTASMNEDDGFDFLQIVGGTITGNTASGNLEDGFDFDHLITGGTIANNTSTGNAINGFDFIAPIISGSIIENNANNNSGDGFFVNIFDDPNTATFSNNFATQNTGDGYDVLTGAPQTGVGTNTGSGNGSNNNY